MLTIPQPIDDDSDDVVLALQVASVQWRQGDQETAIKWLRKAADAAFDSEQDRRGIELSKLAADLSAASPPAPTQGATASPLAIAPTAQYVPQVAVPIAPAVVVQHPPTAPGTQQAFPHQSEQEQPRPAPPAPPALYSPLPLQSPLAGVKPQKPSVPPPTHDASPFTRRRSHDERTSPLFRRQSSTKTLDRSSANSLQTPLRKTPSGSAKTSLLGSRPKPAAALPSSPAASDARGFRARHEPRPAVADVSTNASTREALRIPPRYIRPASFLKRPTPTSETRTVTTGPSEVDPHRAGRHGLNPIEHDLEPTAVTFRSDLIANSYKSGVDDEWEEPTLMTEELEPIASSTQSTQETTRSVESSSLVSSGIRAEVAADISAHSPMVAPFEGRVTADSAISRAAAMPYPISPSVAAGPLPPMNHSASAASESEHPPSFVRDYSDHTGPSVDAAGAAVSRIEEQQGAVAIRVAVGPQNGRVYARILDNHGLRRGEFDAVLVQVAGPGDIRKLFH